MDIQSDQQETALKLIAQNPEGTQGINDILKAIAPKAGETAPNPQQIQEQQADLQKKISDLESKGEDKLTEEEKKKLSTLQIILAILGMATATMLAPAILAEKATTS